MGCGAMNFVKAETIVQEITSDGRVRDIVTERVKSQAEKEAERKEEIIRNLPEFKRERDQGGKSLHDQLADRKAQADDEEKAKEKEYNVHTIDEAEYEHYQHLEDSERAKSRRRAVEEEEAVSDFANARKRLREDEETSGPTLQKSLQNAARERAVAKKKAAPKAADRLRGLVKVKAPAAKGAATTDQSGFPGIYTAEDGEIIATISPDCKKLAWPDASEITIMIEGSTIKMEMDGELSTGVLEANGVLKWSDGDVWTRRPAAAPSAAVAAAAAPSADAAVPAASAGGLVAYASSSDEEA